MVATQQTISREALDAALQQLGAKRVEAALVSALVHGGPQGTQQIVETTGLRQPEVSVGMRSLREMGWIESEPLPRKGKGRPMHRYTLTASSTAVRKHYEERGKQGIEAYKAAIQVIKSAL